MTTDATTNHLLRDPESVAVVGAGPTGVILAIELARRGVNVKVFERLSEPPTESRATGIHARTLEPFRQLGLSMGWKLALVAQHRASPALLDSYQAERLPIAAGVLELPTRS